MKAMTQRTQIARGAAEPVSVSLLAAAADPGGSEPWLLLLQLSTWSLEVAVRGPDDLRALAAFLAGAAPGDELVVGGTPDEPARLARAADGERWSLTVGPAGATVQLALDGAQLRKLAAAAAAAVAELDEHGAARHDV